MAKKIKIYGRIGPSWWSEGVTDSDVRAMLDEAEPNESIELYINSGGGDVFHGAAIYNMLRRHPGTVTAYIDGMAASAASLIAMAADEVVMPENAWFMVHNPWSIAIGNAHEMRDMADWLDELRASMVKNYKRKTGLSDDELRVLLDGDKDHRDGTWLNATRAVELGFADRIEDVEPDEEDERDAESSTFQKAFLGLAAAELSSFRHAPTHLCALARAIQTTNAAMAATHKGDEMPKNRASASVPAVVSADVENDSVDVTSAELAVARAEGARLERERCQAIRERGLKMQLPADTIENIIAQNKDVPASLDLLIDAKAHQQGAEHGGAFRSTQSAGYAVGQDASDKRRAAMSDAIFMRSGKAEYDNENPYRGMTLKEMARQCVVDAGMNPSADNREMIAQAFNHYEAVNMASGGHSKSDFPFIIRDTLRQSVTKGYDEAPEDWHEWCDTTSLSDFREHDLTNLNFFSDLDKLERGEEYSHGTIGDRGEKIRLGKYGKLFSIDWETVVDDNLQLLTRVPELMGRAAARVPGDLAYAVLFDNPTMSDSSALFHADNHNNLITTPLGYDSLTELDVAISTQTITAGEGESERALTAEPEVLLVPRALKHRAKQLNTAEYQDKDNTPNTFRGQFKITSNARLDTNSTTAFYMMTHFSKLQAIILGFLNGNPKPEFWLQDGFKVDGTIFKVRICAAAGAVDWRTIAKSDGTGG